MTGSSKSTIAAAMLVATTITAAASAQQRGSRQTREYVQAAGQSDTFEIMEAYSALAESRDPQVLAFARRMIQDHGATGSALRDATVRAGVGPPPMAVGAGQAPFLAALQDLRGQDFDRAYWHQQALAHRAALTVTQRYAETGDTAAIRGAAASAVPIIQAHLAIAERMDRASGGS